MRHTKTRVNPFRERFATAWSWLGVGAAWHDGARCAWLAFTCAVYVAAAALLIALAPVLALYGSFRPASLFRLIQWLRNQT